MFHAQFCLAFALVNANHSIADALILFTQKTSRTPRTPPPSASSAIRADTAGIGRRRPPLTICGAKLGKIAQNFDLDTILENELTFGDDVDDTPSTEAAPGSKRRGSRRHKSEGKKQRRKSQMKRERLEKQRRQENGTADEAGGDDEDSQMNEDHADILKEMHFLSWEASGDGGKRADSVLVDLLNGGDVEGAVSISRSQCGTLISNGCVFFVPAEHSAEFRSQMEGLDRVPFHIIEQTLPIERKSHSLDPGSILLYPSRESLLSATSSSLLSNFIPPTEIRRQDIPLDILFEDEHMIVLNKQAGMVVHPAAGNWDGTLVNALAHYLTNKSPFGAGEFFEDAAREDHVGFDDSDENRNDAVTNSVPTLRPGIVHRLDKGTTGCIVVAKSSSALAALSESFAKRRVKKHYIAVVIGNPGEDRMIDKPIGRHPIHRQRMRVVPDPSASVSRGQVRLTGPKSTSKGRQAISYIHTMQFDGKLGIVKIQIATGRTHQIRVHLQDHGTPIYGDEVYGMSDWNRALAKRRGITRPLLHAQRLEINHPITGERMVFEARVADDMMDVIKAIWPQSEEISL